MSHRSLLIVEDHPGTRHALRGLFRHRGYTVREAGTVAEGLQSLDPAPCCLLLDLMLPDGGGEAILKRVREKHLATRVIVCTGAQDASVIARVSEWRPDAILFKPIDVKDAYKVCEAV